MSARLKRFGLAALLVLVSHPAYAQTSRTVQDGVFTNAQAARGAAVYDKQCASCHGSDLKGAQGPPLVGDVFVGNWQTTPLSDLVNKIRHTMPANSPGTLTPPQSADLVAHILKAGGFPGGTTELASSDEVLGRIAWPQNKAAGAAAASAARGRVFPPVGNLAQLMRGIFFPNSNLIFTVQTRDPGAPPEAASATGGQTGGFSFVEWGAGIYKGWEVIDNAAIALADASPLMLTPGLRCENGRAAPVTDAAWIKFTEEMIAVARKTYRVSQSRNQEAVADATGDLSDACSNCHRAYRDIRSSGALDPADPSNKAARCMPR